MEELRKKLMEELKNKLGEGYEVSPVDVNKNNGTILHGISILLKGNIGGPTVYVDNFYQRFQGTNEEIEEMIDYILEDIRACYEIDDEELQRNVYEYDRAKEHLRVALCNYEANKETLSSRPHKRILDLAVTACIRSETTPVRGSGFITVSNTLLQIWGVSKEEMFDIALENTMKEEVCCKLSDLLAQEEGLELPPGVEIPLYILTTNGKRLGASMLLNVAALTRIAEELHSNLYIFPSSIHEVLKALGTSFVYETYDMDKLLSPVCHGDYSENCKDCPCYRKDWKKQRIPCEKKQIKRDNINRGCNKLAEICKELGLQGKTLTWDTDTDGNWAENVKGVDDYLVSISKSKFREI